MFNRKYELNCAPIILRSEAGKFAPPVVDVNANLHLVFEDFELIKNVLVADDHPICAQAMKLAVSSIDGRFEIILADSIKEVQAILRERPCDTLLLDLGLADSEGLTNLTIALSVQSDLRVLIVSGNDGMNIISRAARLGASGFLSKSAPLDEMRSAISVVLEGGTYFPQLKDADRTVVAATDRLSPAQSRVLIELAKGHSNKIMAHELNLSEATVKSHLSAIYRILSVPNRAQAILALQEAG